MVSDEDVIAFSKQQENEKHHHVVVSDEDVIAFSKQQENENTKKKTLCDLNIFK